MVNLSSSLLNGQEKDTKKSAIKSVYDKSESLQRLVSDLKDRRLSPLEKKEMLTIIQQTKVKSYARTKKEIDEEKVANLIIKEYDLYNILIGKEIEIPIETSTSSEKEEKQNKKETSTSSEKQKTKRDIFVDENFIIKGLVQSGKTRYIIDFAILGYLQYGRVLIVLRNSDADLKQIYARMQNRIKELFLLAGVPDLGIPIIKKNIKDRGIHITLGNTSLEKFLEWKPKSFPMFMDEADFLDSGKSARTKIIDQLKDNAQGVFAISATVLDFLGKNKVLADNLILVPVKECYRGIGDLIKREIPENSKFLGDIDGDLFEADPNLKTFLKEFTRLPVFESGRNIMPNICLINQTDKKKPCYEAQKKIMVEFPKILTIIYNGDGITYYIPSTQKTNSIVSLRGKIGRIVLDDKSTISDFLQMIKSNNILSNIVIFAGDLAERGMSFVSSDYIWHLTHLRLLIAKSRKMPELIQEAGRLSGNFQDCFPSYLYMTQESYELVSKAHHLQEECMINIKIEAKRQKDQEELDCKEIIESIPVFKDKIVKNMTRDTKILKFKKTQENIGVSMDVYSGRELPARDWYTMYGKKEPTKVDRHKHTKKFDEELKKTRAFADANRIDEEEEEEEYLMIPINQSGQCKETYEFIIEYMEENYKSGWILRSKINIWMQEKNIGNVDQINARFEHLQNKGKKCNLSVTKGLIFKKENGRWKVKLN